MCGVIIALSLLLAILDYRTRAQIKAKAKHIVLASVTFDEQGKILVKSDGSIPMQILQTESDEVSHLSTKLIIRVYLHSSILDEVPSSGSTKCPSVGRPLSSLTSLRF